VIAGSRLKVMVRVIGVRLGLRSSTGADEGPGLRGWGKLGSCTGASTTKGPPQKTVKIIT